MEAQIEEAIKFRKKANFKILTRLSQIIDQYPYLRFHQILMIYKISELGVDKFNEESVEDLWDLSLPVLDKLAVSYDEELAKSPRKSFITNDTPSNTELELKFNIVKEIITDKLKEKADREAAKNKAVEKARLTELLAKKQSEKLESLSEDEIKRRLAELG
jgi:hypothetical protein